MKRKLLLKILILTILAGTLMGRGRIGENEDFAHGGKGSTEIKEETLYDDGDTSYLFRVEGKYFQKYDGSEFKDYYIKGVNIGSSKPNTFPGELGVTEDEYLKWFEQIGEIHANTIRVYTVLMPAFYSALYKYNTTHDEKIYLFQGCWYNEDLI